MTSNKHIGSSFEGFLKEEGIHDEATGRVRKIQAAAAATENVQELVGTAVRILDQGFTGRILNGLGIYDDVSLRKGNLREARDALNSAIEVMDRTAWPKAADYDEEP